MIALGGAAVLAGVPAPTVALMAAAWLWPLPTSAVVLTLVAGQVRRDSRQATTTSPEVAFLVAVGAELRAGSSLRLALSTAGRQVSELAAISRYALSGRPIGELAKIVETELPRHGGMTAAALRLADGMGGSMAPLFEELAAQVIDAEELRRERRVAIAPALAQGIVVGGIPVLVLAWMLISGQLGEVVSSGPAAVVVVAAGCLLTFAGVAAVALMLRRAAR